MPFKSPNGARDLILRPNCLAPIVHIALTPEKVHQVVFVLYVRSLTRTHISNWILVWPIFPPIDPIFFPLSLGNCYAPFFPRLIG